MIMLTSAKTIIISRLFTLLLTAFSSFPLSATASLLQSRLVDYSRKIWATPVQMTPHTHKLIKKSSAFTHLSLLLYSVNSLHNISELQATKSIFLVFKMTKSNEEMGSFSWVTVLGNITAYYDMCYYRCINSYVLRLHLVSPTQVAYLFTQ